MVGSTGARPLSSRGLVNRSAGGNLPPARLANGPLQMEELGEIYVLVNPAMPGLVKVGKTRGESTCRASQLSGATGVPEHFKVVRIYKVLDVDAAELLAHKVLERTNGRPNDLREFFLGPVDKVVEILDQALLRYAPPANDLPETWRLAVGKARNGQPTLAFSEFEFAIRQGQVPFHQSALSAQVVEALGAYGACCCFFKRKPTAQRLFSNMNYRTEISIRMIEFLTVFQVDEPEMHVIDFVRGLQ